MIDSLGKGGQSMRKQLDIEEGAISVAGLGWLVGWLAFSLL